MMRHSHLPAVMWRTGGVAAAAPSLLRVRVGPRRKTHSNAWRPPLHQSRCLGSLQGNGPQHSRPSEFRISRNFASFGGEDSGADGIYKAPFATPVRMLKIFSVTSCIFSMASTPVLVFLSDSDIPFGARAGIGATVVFAALGTTAVLNWMFKPYALEIRRSQEDNQSLLITTLTFFGRKKIEEMNVEKVEVGTTHPMSNIVNKETGNGFYVHTNWAEGESVVRSLLPMLPLDSDSEGSGKENEKKFKPEDDD